MIGVVVVSHSHALAEAAVALASEMVDADDRPRLVTAAGLDETTFGTDAMRVVEAIGSADSGDGVLVFCDLGSAVLSAEMALEFLEPEVAQRVRVTSAPLVEGLVAAVVTAATGADLDQADAEARQGLRAKQEHLGQGSEPAGSTADAPQPNAGPAPTVTWTHTLTNEHGLHARPAAAIVGALRVLDAQVQLRNATTGAGPADAASVTAVAALGLERGHELSAAFSGPDADAARDALAALAERDFGDQPAAAANPPAPSPAAATGPAVVVSLDVDTSRYDPSADEAARLADALAAVDAHFTSLATGEPQAPILNALSGLLRDPSVSKAMRAAVDAGACAVDAVTGVLRPLAGQFEQLPNAYQRERAQDVRSIERHLLRALTGSPLTLALPSGILVVDELDAPTAAQLSPDHTPGVCVHAAGDSGHGVLIARAKGIVVCTGYDTLQVTDGAQLTLDGAAT